MPNQIQMLYIPDTMANWPWPRKTNSFHEQVAQESNVWIHGFKAFTERSQQAMDKCDFCLLAALTYVEANRDHFRIACDLTNFFFVIDEYTDVESAPVVHQMIDIVIDALNNPHKPRPQGEVVLGEMARQFWSLAIKTATPTSRKHFLRSFTDYLNSIAEQAADRDNNYIRTIEEYLVFRRENIGARPSFAAGELHLNLPDHVFDHPVLKELQYYSADLIILDNDIASYNKEQATGDDLHNILTIAMHQFQTDYDGAIAWVSQYHQDVQTKFLQKLKMVPSFGPEIDEKLWEFINHVANCPRGNYSWNFESGRYFGKKGMEIMESRYVALLPKLEHDRSLKREQVVVPLIDA
ncbi:hypothetical protein JAAARDRAFT_453389 [Jaapia argillacea MUCL 33604]|uniref:Terpene synthase n=1 Tax=Jaapia argillacea MUCL 33604 TaxID=933084 RepID=A0A067Q5C0_9AGAM|nr:hypothetical protein JAAARDRAFT_453389 [Jaapia argillacea MUCL 33604]